MTVPKHLQKAAAEQSHAVAKPKALEIMASRLSVDPTKMLDTLKATVFKNATNEELLALVAVSNEYKLNPFLKEIYAFPSKGGGIAPIVSVDGWIKMINRQEAFDGIEFAMEGDEVCPVSCTATIHVKGRSKPVSVTEYYEECFRDTDVWRRMPRRMLRHKAMIQAGRVAFGFSGVYDEDEAIDITATTTVTTDRATTQRITEPAAGDNSDSGYLPNEEPTPTQPAKGSEAAQSAKTILPAGKLKSASELPTIVAQFQAFLDEIKCPLGRFAAWCETDGHVSDATSMGSLDEFPGDVLRRLLKHGRAGMTEALTRLV